MSERNINLTEKECNFIEYLFEKYQIENDLVDSIKEKLLV